MRTKNGREETTEAASQSIVADAGKGRRGEERYVGARDNAQKNNAIDAERLKQRRCEGKGRGGRRRCSFRDDRWRMEACACEGEGERLERVWKTFLAESRHALMKLGA